MKITKEMLIQASINENDSRKDVENFIQSIESYFHKYFEYTPSNAWVIFSWEDSPNLLKNLFNWNGGDEDWVAVYGSKNEPEYLPLWISDLDSCKTPDIYYLDNYIVYIGSHS